MQAALEQQVKLAHRDPNRRLCVYTDASGLEWSGVVTQVPHENPSLPQSDQCYRPLAFLSRRFTGAQLCRSTIEKMAFAIMATVEHMHWIIGTAEGYDPLTAYHSLVFLFVLLAVVIDPCQTFLRSVLRWVIILSAYIYTCMRIDGDEVVWADPAGR